MILSFVWRCYATIVAALVIRTYTNTIALTLAFRRCVFHTPSIYLFTKPMRVWARQVCCAHGKAIWSWVIGLCVRVSNYMCHQRSWFSIAHTNTRTHSASWFSHYQTDRHEIEVHIVLNHHNNNKQKSKTNSDRISLWKNCQRQERQERHKKQVHFVEKERKFTTKGWELL